MKTNRKALKSKTGFTIVELLTVMSVIAILITLLVPALTLVRDFAKEIQQKAQFHSIEVGVEMFKTEFGSYPESNDNDDLYDTNKSHPEDDTPYCGANKLAEAMVGQDLLGFHHNSDFRSDGENLRNDGTGDPSADPVPYDVYHAKVDDAGVFGGLFAETKEENVQARKGPFLDLENANAYIMEDIYGDSLSVGFDIESLVLCDEYVAKREGAKKTGMPILYYRARKIYTQQDSEDALDIANDIYYYPDNQNLLELGLPEDDTLDHPLSDDPTNDYLDFENMIINTQITQIKRPYRADSYILISAGKDGLYGTPDDLFNFEKD